MKTLLNRRSALQLSAGALMTGPSLAWSAEPLLRDNFSDPNLKQRRALRGDWKFAAGAATCTQDDALYAKFQNHGPIIFWDLAVTDAVVRFSVKPDKDVKTVVFTANADTDHVFRFIINPAGLNVRAFPPGDKVPPSIAVAQTKLALPPAAWTDFEVTLRGPRATIKIGDHPVINAEHETYARPKSNLAISFSFGTLGIKDFVVMP